MKRGSILWVENNPDYLNVRSEFLEEAGYEIIKAKTLKEAELLLQQHHIHLIILDIRLENDDNPFDKSGLDWAVQASYHHLPKIILTGYPSLEMARKALRSGENGQSLAVDFLDKNDEPEDMIMALDRAFNQHIPINWELQFHWEFLGTFASLVQLLNPDFDQTCGSGLVEEMMDLFRKLFHNYAQVTIGRLFTQRLGRIVLAVHAFTEAGKEKDFIVACGQRDILAQESRNHHLFYSNASNINQTQQLAFAETTHLAVIAYTLDGVDLNQATLLRDYCQYVSSDKLTRILDNLFENTLLPHYIINYVTTTKRDTKEILFKWAGLQRQNIAKILSENRLKEIYQKAVTTGLIKPNVIEFNFQLELLDDFPASLTQGLTYGQLHGEGILIDARGQTWLIDFSSVEQGPLLRDFITLETWLRFNLLKTKDVQLQRALTQQTLTVEPYDDYTEDNHLPPESIWICNLLNGIQQHYDTLSKNDRDTYLKALTISAIGYLLHYDPKLRWHTKHSLATYLHSLILADVLSQMLISNSEPDVILDRHYQLHVDETNEEVWVNKRRIALAPKEYKLFLLLYQNANQTCTYDFINKQIYGNPPEIDSKETIQPAIMRLRKKIEPIPNQPQFIMTARGKGYRLDLEQIPQKN